MQLCTWCLGVADYSLFHSIFSPHVLCVCLHKCHNMTDREHQVTLCVGIFMLTRLRIAPDLGWDGADF